jgi:DNA-binding response OmpR family regulator
VNKKKVLVVDDEVNIAELLRMYLEKDGYEVRTANDGKAALREFESFLPDLVLLDIMLPIMDGWQVCREIRKQSNIPVIMITAKAEIFDKVLGLELGADDYVVKPFDAKEVLARVKAVLRRTMAKEDNDVKGGREVTLDNLYINMDNYELRIKGKRVEVPPKEMELLYYLTSNPDKVFTRDQLLDAVWGFEYFGDSRTVDVHIKRIREKIEGISDRWALKTVWGVGYKVEIFE